SRSELAHRLKLARERPRSRRRQAIWPPGALITERLDQACRLQPRDRAIQAARTESASTDPLDVVLHRVPVFRFLREAHEDEQRLGRVLVVRHGCAAYYAPRSTDRSA